MKNYRHSTSHYRMGFGAPLGALTVRPGVAVLQGIINFYRTSVGKPTMSADGKYGATTHAYLKDWVKFRIRSGTCGAGYTTAMIDAYGPNAVRDCIGVQNGVTLLNSSQLADIQAGWEEWRESLSGGGGGGGTDPDAAARAACEASGGVWDAAQRACTSARVEDEGMGIGGWLAVVALGGAVAYGIWYAVSED